MKLGPCVHWNDECMMTAKCIFKKNGKCTKDGIVEHRELVIDKIENVGKRKQINRLSEIRDLNN